MPDGACVIRYDGKRGVVWRIKWKDAGGRQTTETLGRADEGWTRRKANAELRDRLSDVHRHGRRKLPAVTFASFAAEWWQAYPAARGLKHSTREGYRQILDLHLLPAFGSLKLDLIDVERVEQYAARKSRSGLASGTVNRHLNLLSLLMGGAVKRQLARVNPVPLVDRPRELRRHWVILSPTEIGRVERAFVEMISEAAEMSDERYWREQARVIFLTTVGTGLRRGELLGLKWRDVNLADPAGASLRVRQAVVRGRIDTPKSERSVRTLALGPRLAEELWQHRRASRFQGDDEGVFCSPSRGTPFDPARYSVTFKAARVRAKVDPAMRPFHDGRHTSITNSAAAGIASGALMARAGHVSLATTQRYIDLSGETFRDEAEQLEERLWGAPVRDEAIVEPQSAE